MIGGNNLLSGVMPSKRSRGKSMVLMSRGLMPIYHKIIHFMNQAYNNMMYIMTQASVT